MLAFQLTPPAITDLWLERLAANGITELRTDPSNTPKYWAEAIRTANRVGLKTILNIIYSISPKHSDDYFAYRFREAAKLKPYRLCLKIPVDSSLPTQLGGWCRFFARSQRDPGGVHTIATRGWALCVAWKPSS
jgi:pyruvate/oxaloacetate carboxyltransferase